VAPVKGIAFRQQQASFKLQLSSRRKKEGFLLALGARQQLLSVQLLFLRSPVLRLIAELLEASLGREGYDRLRRPSKTTFIDDL
jgi:hypothetical protein